MFGNKKKLNLLEQAQANLIKSQENLEITQKNIEKFFDVKDSKPLEVQLLKNEDDEQKPLEVLVRKAPDYIPEKEYDEKWKAAYALNLCTVSVSQIVEYDDIRTLDQEYSTILNNLNLQNMPKDEALLDILKQLLNVITFFKIQEGDKEMLEKEYQHKMKNAIWNAVPNMSVILTTPDPKVMLFNLATQVGIGYMNYRKEKANTQLEQDKQKWQLKRSAMEQINGLRRELFDTAWRLSKEYDFDDVLRLSERQIEQYNKILIDNNAERKYERLLSIKETFKAYPPFWYYLGHTATEIGKTPEAIGSFYEFLRLTGNKTINRQNVIENSNLLREDHLCASCALELAGLVSDDREEMLKLLDIAVETSGNSLDVLQMCAMTYITIKENLKAIDILRYLGNEGYNIDLNFNLLSKLYFEEMTLNNANAYEKYSELKEREDSKHYVINIPNIVPTTDVERDIIMAAYNSKEKQKLSEKKSFVFCEFANMLKNLFDNICVEDGDINYNVARYLKNTCNIIDDFFLDIERKDLTGTDLAFLSDSTNIELNPNSLNDFLNRKSCRSIEMKNTIYEKIVEEHLLADFEEKLIDLLKKLKNEDIFKVSYAFDSFCLKNNLPIYSSVEKSGFDNDLDPFLIKIHTETNAAIIKSKIARKDVCLNVIKNYQDKLIKSKKDNKDIYLAIFDNDEMFNRYIKKWKKQLDLICDENEEVIAVLNDKTISDEDLVFTTHGYFLFSNYHRISSSKKNKVLYTMGVENSSHENAFKIGKYVYDNSRVDINEICKMIREIASKVRDL